MNYPKTSIMLTDKILAKTIESYPLIFMMCFPTMELTFGNPLSVIDIMAKKYEKKAVISPLNIDENKKIASHFDITTTPTVLIFKNQRLISYLKNDVTRNAIEKSRLPYSEEGE